MQRRLALARVSPALIENYRNGEMDLALLQAFTISDDHKAQEEVWERLSDWNRRPGNVRQLLSNGTVSASDKRVQFVGLDEYLAAGGAMKQDLFADEETGDGIYICDIALLNDLAQKKLEATANQVKSDGWKWVNIQPDDQHDEVTRHRRVQAKPLPLAPKQAAELETLEEQQRRLSQEMDEADEEDDELYERLQKVEDRIEELRDSRQYEYPEDVKQAAGVIVSIGHDGTPNITYGLVRKEDEKQLASSGSENAARRDISEATTTERPAFSAALTEALTAHKTAAIAAELAQNTHVSLAAVVYTLTLREFGLDLHCYRTKSCLQLSSTRPVLKIADDAPALAHLTQQREHWSSELPKDPAELWSWTLAQEDAALLRLLAYLAGISINAIQTKHDSEAMHRARHADALATALGVDMSRWFQATAENYFDHVSKAKIIEALQEVGKEAGEMRKSMKKALLAKIAESELRACGWLPEILRFPSQSQ